MNDCMPSICPECGQPMDFFNAFMAHGSHCRYCGYKWEISEATREIKVSNELILYSDCTENQSHIGCEAKMVKFK